MFAFGDGRPLAAISRRGSVAFAIDLCHATPIVPRTDHTTKGPLSTKPVHFSTFLKKLLWNLNLSRIDDLLILLYNKHIIKKVKETIMGFNFYVLSWMFLIYSFLGWCAEVVFVALDTKQFDNRGFLRGPVCPIYGVGITLILFCLKPFTENWIVLFIISVIFTTVLELVVGIFLKKCFHHEWWNYSQFRFNFRGYICLRFSLLWGVGCLFVVKLLHPAVAFFIHNCPRNIGLPLIWLFSVIFIIYVVVTLFYLSLIKI